MAADKYLKLDGTSGRPTQVTATVVSTGAGEANKIVALDAGGLLDISVIPSGVGGADTQALVTTETLTEGMIVNIYNNSGTPACRKAIATDTTKPACGFVIAGFSSAGTATVYEGGKNNKIPIGSFTAADIGKEVFLSASVGGGVTTTPPTSSGNLVQGLGKIVNIDASYITIKWDLREEIVA